MKIKYSYYQLRFPDDVAMILHRVQEELDAVYIDIPFLLPKESKICEFNGSKIATFENKEYFIATEGMDVCFKAEEYLKERYFGLINITRGVPCYILWTTFYDDKLEFILTAFKGKCNIRTYTNPMRASVMLECGDINV